MHTILGSTGIIAIETAKELKKYNSKIRLVSRNPFNVNGDDELVKADLKNYDEVLNAVQDSEVVYLLAGLIYKSKVWAEEWPLIMKNVIEACKKVNAKLVFFDNVYMYGKVNGWMKEDSPIKPISKKGEVRAQIAQLFIDEYSSGKINAAIVRSADFYGPGTIKSAFNETVIKRLMNGQSAIWFVNDNVKHSYTYTKDAGKAVALIGNTPSAFNQIWHIPTDKNALTGKDYIELAAKFLGVKPKYMVTKKWLLSVMGLASSIVKENNEMLYQNEFDYLFDSSKFESTFNVSPTPYEQSLKVTIDEMKRTKV
ncbi:MAG TPA: NAD-dependent epimerase/dehydratase family protein [Ignavibacteriaceae bacterium]|nr:NAD-dependent epimerase/dehydratase family protein [Ignavibacteriaceae bacterium]